MKAVWLSSTYYLDPAIEELSANAERLFTRALAYCGNAETSGYISTAAIKKLGLTNPAKLAGELVQAGILVASTRGGWQFRTWSAWNGSGDKLLDRQRADRDRQARKRDRDRLAQEQISRETSRDVTGTEQNRTEKNIGHVPDEDSRNQTRTTAKSSSEFADGVPIPPDPDPPIHIETGGKPRQRTPGAGHRTLVRACIGNGYPRATIDALAIRVEALIGQGVDPKHIEAGLKRWPTVPGAIPTWLDSIVGDARKSVDTQQQTNGAATAKAEGWLAIGAQFAADPHAQRAINR